jgi:hypothetical protein
MRSKRWILVAAASFFLLVFIVWVVVSLRDDDSTLNVLTRYAKERTCWFADSSNNISCVVKSMNKYRRRGRYDDAISTGAAWADKYPSSFMGGAIYRDISVLYLQRARIDSSHADAYLKQALLYRDKALTSASDSPASLQSLAAISEAVGDLSAPQRCVQYGNSIKFLDRMNLLTNEDKDELKRQFKPDLAKRKRIEFLSEWIDAEMRRVSEKSSVSGCQVKPYTG